MNAREKKLAKLFGIAVLGAGLLASRDLIQTGLHQAQPTQPTLVLIVLDTVRADHLSACGYERPTSPTLERLIQDGAAMHCQTYAPGSWTFPSHASLFSGLEVPEHGAHFVGDQALLRALAIQPLDGEIPLLAEDLVAQGYQTRGVSGNPVLAQASGLGRGFQDWRVAPGFGPWNGEGLVQQVTDSLRQADADQPLFLFVNIADAHDPWYPAKELDWVPSYPGTLAYFEVDDDGVVLPDGPWQRYVMGRMPELEAEQLRQEVTDRYDRALHQSDATLAAVLNTLRAHNWDQAGLRVVITSDHGEFLGEHGILRHGRYLYEENNRVPLLVWDSAGSPALPEGPMSMLAARELILGQAPAERAVRAVAFPDPLWTEQSGGVLGTEMSVAVWEGQGKEHWIAGESMTVDLTADPLEQAPTPAAPSAQVLERVQAAKTSAARQTGEMDPGLQDALRAAGYLE
ncbi:MAG: hypothetical protein ACI9VR_000801 [Cognaticolwellia sp.]|jgi:hypothetical protein